MVTCYNASRAERRGPLSLGQIWCIPGCDKSATSVESVLVQDHAISKQAAGYLQQGSTLPDTVAWVVQSMSAIDTMACPPDFREAYARHLFAWKQLSDQIRSEPQTFLQGFGMGILNEVTRGELDGGESRIADAHDQCVQAVKTTWGEVEALAARYGAKMPQ